MAPQFIAQHPELPWDDMRDMRNVVIHAYFAVDLQVVWRTVQEDLPKLKQQIDQLLSQPPRTGTQNPTPDESPVRADGGATTQQTLTCPDIALGCVSKLKNYAAAKSLRMAGGLQDAGAGSGARLSRITGRNSAAVGWVCMARSSTV